MNRHIDQPRHTEQDTDGKTPAEPVLPGHETGGESGYYYDDATGYEVYDPDADDDTDDEPLDDQAP